MAAILSVPSATPYTWPYHGRPDAARLALVALCDQRWRPRPAAADVVLDALARSVRRAGGFVVAVTSPSSTAPFAADEIVLATGTSGFHGTQLDDVLRRAGRSDLLLAGYGLEGPVHSTMREANDRGYECLLVPDACHVESAELAAAACSMVMHSGGIFGAYAPAADVIAALGGGGATVHTLPLERSAR